MTLAVPRVARVEWAAKDHSTAGARQPQASALHHRGRRRLAASETGRHPEASMRAWLCRAAPTFPSRGRLGRICDPRPAVFALECVCVDRFLAVRARATMGRPGAAYDGPAVLAPNRIGPDLLLAEVAFLRRRISHGYTPTKARVDSSDNSAPPRPSPLSGGYDQLDLERVMEAFARPPGFKCSPDTFGRPAWLTVHGGGGNRTRARFPPSWRSFGNVLDGLLRSRPIRRDR
jgi:hypothetical protein